MLEGNYSAGMTGQYPEHPVRGQRWQTVISVFPDWEQRILLYAEHARELLAEDSAISERLERARDRANDDAKRRLQILRLQIDRADDTVVREMLEATREGEQELLDAIKHGLKEPRIQMIAAGAYVLGSEKIDVVE
jgi:predicted transcriptional regulator